MKVFITLLGREMRAFFYSPIAYVILFYFLLLSGVNFWYQLVQLNGYPTEGTVVEAVFVTGLFWFPFILSFPLITMRVYSEEFRLGTFESLSTTPVNDWQIVLAKQAGVLLFYCLLWLPTLILFAVFQQFTGRSAANAAGAYWGAYLLLLLAGLFYSSIGCLASSLTKDQVNAATICFSSVTLFIFFSFLPQVLGITAPLIRDLFSYFSTVQHMQDFSMGIIDSRAIVYYLSMTALMMFLTFQVLQYRRWKS